MCDESLNNLNIKYRNLDRVGRFYKESEIFSFHITSTTFSQKVVKNSKNLPSKSLLV